MRETFQDWTVGCEEKDGRRVCLLSQQQRHKETGQLVLAVELSSAQNDTLAGNFVLPFGLKLAQGVTLRVDERAPSPAIPFSSCLPVGCLVPIAFDGGAVEQLRAGAGVHLEAVAHEGGGTVAFRVSLAGFSAAHDRLKVLAKQ